MMIASKRSDSMQILNNSMSLRASNELKEKNKIIENKMEKLSSRWSFSLSDS